MKRALFFIIAAFLCSGCFSKSEKLGRPSIDEQSHLMAFQIRVPQAHKLTDGQFELVHELGSASTPIKSCSVITDGQFSVYSFDTLIFLSKRRHLRVTTGEFSAQYFTINHPPMPEVSEWSTWLKPDFISDSWNPWWEKTKDVERSKPELASSPNGLELRFKVTKWTSPD